MVLRFDCACARALIPTTCIGERFQARYEALRTGTELKSPFRMFQSETPFGQYLLQHLLQDSRVLSHLPDDPGNSIRTVMERLLPFFPPDQVNPASSTFHLLYRASEHGFSALTFHQRCDHQGPTLVLVRTPPGSVCGGYAAASWQSQLPSVYHDAGGQSFLFSLAKPGPEVEVGRPYPCDHPPEELCFHSTRGPVFGAGHDLYLADACHSSNASRSNFGKSYGSGPDGQHPSRSLVQEGTHFEVAEYEVWGVQ